MFKSGMGSSLLGIGLSILVYTDGMELGTVMELRSLMKLSLPSA